MSDTAYDPNYPLGLVYPDLANRVRAVYASMIQTYAKEIRVAEGLRDYKRQEALYAQGRTTPGKIVTYAKPEESLHCFGLAVDSRFYGNGDPYLEKVPPGIAEDLWEQFGRMTEKQGLTWGGRWPAPKTDKPHVQITYGVQLNKIQAIYKEKGLLGVWAYLDQIRGV